MYQFDFGAKESSLSDVTLANIEALSQIEINLAQQNADGTWVCFDNVAFSPTTSTAIVAYLTYCGGCIELLATDAKRGKDCKKNEN